LISLRRSINGAINRPEPGGGLRSRCRAALRLFFISALERVTDSSRTSGHFRFVPIGDIAGPPKRPRTEMSKCAVASLKRKLSNRRSGGFTQWCGHQTEPHPSNRAGFRRPSYEFKQQGSSPHCFP